MHGNSSLLAAAAVVPYSSLHALDLNGGCLTGDDEDDVNKWQ